MTDVERVDDAVHGDDTTWSAAAVQNGWTPPRSLPRTMAARGDSRAVGHGSGRVGRHHVEAVTADPGAGVLPGDLDDRQMEDGAHARLHDQWRAEPHPAFGDEHGDGAGTVRAPDDRPEIPGKLETVGYQNCRPLGDGHVGQRRPAHPSDGSDAVGSFSVDEPAAQLLADLVARCAAISQPADNLGGAAPAHEGGAHEDGFDRDTRRGRRDLERPRSLEHELIGGATSIRLHVSVLPDAWM